MRKVLLLLFIFALVLSLAAAGWLYARVSASHAPSAPVEVMISPGAASAQIAHRLEQQGVITSSLALRLWLRLQQADQSLKSGLYRFEQADSIIGIMQRLQQGDVMHFNLTVPEGLRNDEVLQLLAAQTGVALQQWQQALNSLLSGETEGRLLPETWQYSKPLDPVRFLRTMIQAQQKLLHTLSPDAAVQQRLRIIASIIEKETALDRERPLVSAAIHNRLQRGMPLQMDPTVIYGIYRTQGAFSGNLHRKDLSSDTPWNSYTRRGLPPTPICNPGTASLLAAAAPAAVDYLYFVADGSGGHAFAATLAEHDRNVRRWVELEKRRDHGK
ncbi:MAG: endolytic transglycosylase MltG [Zetaproteobacteria bacterium CG12_big_fil_rev_8_21_14_0_65_54_13]|nr:MAG: endolytic transglycosylase MltG [Zetaproteobacteria bacterium CG12_big_fil_rev_8_21_14_0_65_54_13]PIX55642.1 MAG: endolytic transglycosylase MltG [Zetaproteobacteria bacterium CG_4_10_14_3_um_filter_54_28]PJA30650.1 MAG: endolytic transglycosylase MltG [Zetaproteobacteria bacterium CG_4_9_14_3_um_filter_54_145]